jgi:hypothetical protein
MSRTVGPGQLLVAPSSRRTPVVGLTIETPAQLDGSAEYFNGIDPKQTFAHTR